MQYQESRDDDIGQRSQEIIFDLPHNVSDRRADEPELREPIVELVERVEPSASTEAPVVNPFVKWLQRSIAVLSIFSMAVLVFLGAVSAFRIVMDDPRVDATARPQTAVATNAQPAPSNVSSLVESDTAANTVESNVASPNAESDVATNEQPADELELSDDFYTPSFGRGYATAGITTTRSTFHRKRSPLRRVEVAGYQSTRPEPATRQPLEPLFFPTTLVIYVENGEIKSRLEPWVQTTPTPDN